MSLNLSESILADCDVAIVGGGVLGCSLAYFLSLTKTDVCLIDKGELCSEASGANAGSIHEQSMISMEEFDANALDRSAQMVPYNVKGAQVWRELASDLEIDARIQIVGGLGIIEKEANMDIVRLKVERENYYGSQTRLISKAELLEMAPYVAERATGAIYAPNEGKIDILNALPPLWQNLHAGGVNILTHHRVENIERDSCQIMLRTSSGKIKCRRLVIAGGSWNRHLAKMIGWDIVIHRRAIQGMITEKAPPIIKHMVHHTTRRITMKQTNHGSILLGGGWPGIPRPVGFPPRVDPNSMISSAKTAIRIVPELAGLPIVRAWTSYISTPADDLPCVGPIPGAENCYILSANIFGVTLGPFLARTLANQMLNGPESSFDKLISPSRKTLRSVNGASAPVSAMSGGDF